jgi:hypothetical protein
MKDLLTNVNLNKVLGFVHETGFYQKFWSQMSLFYDTIYGNEFCVYTMYTLTGLSDGTLKVVLFQGSQPLYLEHIRLFLGFSKMSRLNGSH